MAASKQFPYRVVIRDFGLAQEITNWLNDNLQPDAWQVEFLGIEERDNESRAVRFAVRFRRRLDMMDFKKTWMGPSNGASPVVPYDELLPLKGMQIIAHFLTHPGEDMYVRRRRLARQ